MKIDNLRRFMVKFKHQLTDRSKILSLFTYMPDRPVIETTAECVAGKQKHVKLINGLKEGDIIICQVGKQQSYCFVENVDLQGYDFVKLSDVENMSAPVDVVDTFDIQKGDIENFKEVKAETTAGRFLFNQVVLVDVFGDAIDYVNKEINPTKLSNSLSSGFISKQFKPEQFYKYIDRIYFMDQFAEICVPTETEKSMTTHPLIGKRKKELVEKYKDRLDDPVTIAKIEQELINMDKEYLKGDAVTRFLRAGKDYSIHRKKMFLMVGGIAAFTDGGGGKTDFIENSLAEGWDKEKFHLIANEIRKGSYARGQETMKGGVQAKLILRVFQDVLITANDCKSKVGYPIQLTEHNIQKYMGRHILTKTGQEVLSKTNMGKYKNKKVIMRSPMTCKTKDGICKICAGDEFSALDNEAIITMALQISATLLYLFMKLMHGETLEIANIPDPTEYIL